MRDNNRQQEKENNFRRMKVLRGFRQDRNGNDVPLVQLTGAWVQAAGFCPGDKILITVEVGNLKYIKSDEIQHRRRPAY